MSKRPRHKRETHFARSLAAIKHEFQMLLGTLDPISAFNYLHNEGIVSQADKEDLDRDLARCDSEDTDKLSQSKRARWTVSTPDTSSHESTKKPQSREAEKVARRKLSKIVEAKKDHVELKNIVTALTSFQELHQVVQRRRSIVPIVQEDGNKDSRGKRGSRTPEPGSDERLLSAFEQGTHDPEELIQILKETRQDSVAADLTNFEGKTLLHLACCMQPVEVVKTLTLEYNCDPNAQDNDGNTPLHEASRCRKPVVVKFLVDLPNCNPNILNSNKETPLHLALSKQHWRLSKVLLKSTKVDKTIKNGRGESLAELIEKHPQEAERTKFKRYLTRRVSLLSSSSADTEENEVTVPLRGGSALSPVAETKKSSVKPEKATSRAGQRGILRPYNLSSIRTSPVTIDMEDSDSEESARGAQVQWTGNDSKYTCTCFDAWLLTTKVGLFVVALLMCLILLLCIIYFFLTSSSP